MRLLELTPAEIAFLTAHPAEPEALQARLTRKLAATLGARLRLPVQVAALAPADAAAGGAPATPDWQPDAALAGLWLTRRLGGRRVEAAPFVPRSLLRTLDAMLAECWLDAAAPTLPPALAWRIAADPMPATLAVQLPSHTTDMTRWAREVIRHG
ncbi:MAG: hypothetical protein BGO60_05405 [Thiobacillus sp. 65-1059]|nr:MAG: hypothetical protein BGO60_05405 [Thiobacillus sp. 65-1059]